MSNVDAFQSFLNSLIIYSIVCSKKIYDRNKLAFLKKDYAIYLIQKKVVRKYFSIPESFNNNIKYQYFKHKLNFGISQHKFKRLFCT